MTAEVPLTASCPVCGTPVVTARARRCERCETPHHDDCWAYAGGCAIFGCAREGASPSRESSSSRSSSRSLPSPLSPTPPFHRWLWIYRAYAYAMSAFAVGFVLVLLGQVTVDGLLAAARALGVPRHAVLFDLPFTLFVLAWQAVAFATFTAFNAALVCALPAALLRRRAEETLSLGLAPPREGVRAVLDRLDTDAVGSLLLRGLRLLHPAAAVVRPVGLTLLALGVGLLTVGLARDLGKLAFEAGSLATIAAWPLLAAHDRLAWAETLQHRVAASLKSLTSGRP